MKRDQKFFDIYSLVIGVLALIGIGIFVLASRMSEMTQGVYTADSAEYKAAVASRLKPFGQTYVPGEEIPAGEPQVAEAPAAKPVATTMTGPQVFNAACIACHGSGVGGAPMLTDVPNWAARIAKGIDTLHQHAISGFAGDSGFMPPKGGRTDLSDDEIYGAVDYMVSEAKKNQ